MCPDQRSYAVSGHDAEGDVGHGWIEHDVHSVASVDGRKCDGFVAVVGFAPAHVYEPYGTSAVAGPIGPLVELSEHYLDEGAMGRKIEIESHCERLIVPPPANALPAIS